MSARNIAALRRRHEGDTICVVGSGASVDHISARFFDAFIVVAVNEMWHHVRTDYLVAHHHERLQEAIDLGVTVVTSDRDWGGPGWGQPCTLKGEYYTYRTATNTCDTTPRIDRAALALDTVDSLVVSPSTISEALQFAAHLGAGTILCCGIDGAALDGRWNVRGYNADPVTGHCAGTNPQHVRLTWPIVRETVDALRARGVRVHSLSPFVGADHEGHTYTMAPVLDGRDLLNALKTINWQQPREETPV